MATVKFTYALKRFYPDLDTVEVPAEDVNSVVQSIDLTYPGIKSYLLDDQGSLRKHVNIYIGEDLVEDRDALSDAIGSSDQVLIFQALSGG